MAETPASPLEFPDSPLARIVQQPLLLGLFLPIQSGGWSPSSLPRSTSWEFDYNARLTQRAEALGFDLAFGLAQWMGKGGTGGAIRFREQSLDPFITATSLAVITQRILLISTVHVLYGPWHPLYLAKLGATIDHISNGRWGLNVVTGFVPERSAHVRQRADRPRPALRHGGRVHRADAGAVGVAGECELRGPVLAAHRCLRHAKAALRTAAPRECDGLAGGYRLCRHALRSRLHHQPGGGHVDAAIAALPQHNAEIKAKAAACGREVRTIINPMIICRPTESEARAYYDAIVAAADVGAIEGFLGRRASGDAKGWKTDLGAYRAVGGNMQIVGSPTQVVERFVQLKQAGCDGVQLTFFDFAEDLEFFGAQVLPLMRQAGLRN